MAPDNQGFHLPTFQSGLFSTKLLLLLDLYFFTLVLLLPAFPDLRLHAELKAAVILLTH